MAVTEKYTGSSGLLQDDLENDYFEIDGNSVLFTPGTHTTSVDAVFQNTCHPSWDNVSWIQAQLDLYYYALDSNVDFEAIITLLGLSENGDEEIITENVLTSINTNPTHNLISKDLASNVGKASLKRIDNSETSGKIGLRLPMRASNFEYIKFKRYGPVGWTNCLKIAMTGGSVDFSGNITGLITLPYVTGMKSDFSDLRFYAWNGSQLQRCCHQRVSKTDGSTVNVFVQMPYLPKSPASQIIYCFYGNSTATSASTSLSPLYLFEDYEAGTYTGSVNTGSVDILHSIAIDGYYSLRHTGEDISINRMPYVYPNETHAPSIINSNFNLVNQGSGTYDPYIALFYLQYVDYNNYVRVDTFWDGTNQIWRIRKNVNGTQSNLATWIGGSSKLATDIVHTVTIADYLPSSGTQGVAVWIDGVRRLYIVGTGLSNLANTQKGFGCLQGAQCVFDNITIQAYSAGFITSSGILPTTTYIGPGYTVAAISPDAYADSDLYIKYSIVSPHPAGIVAKEYLSSEYKSTNVFVNAQDKLELGPNGLDQYDALRWRVDLNAGNDVYFRANWSKFQYSPQV